MLNFTAVPKIGNIIEKTIHEHIDEWKKMLKKGDLLNFEKSLFTELLNVYDSVANELMSEAATEMFKKLKGEASASGARKIRLRPLMIRLGAGTTIKVESPYITGNVGEWTGSRHLLETHWSIIGGASPELYDKVGYCTALGPSYQVSNQTLGRFGTEISLSSTHDISNRLASCCMEYGEEALMLKKDENVRGEIQLLGYGASFRLWLRG